MDFKKSVYLNDTSIPISGTNLITVYGEIFTAFDTVDGDIYLNNVILEADIENTGSADDSLEIWASKTGRAIKGALYIYPSAPSYTTDSNASYKITSTPILISGNSTEHIKITINSSNALTLLKSIMENGEIYILFKNQINSSFYTTLYVKLTNIKISVSGYLAYSLINPIF